MESTFEKSRLNSINTLLRILYGIVPIAAGLDKFTNLLVNWTIYINPLILKIIPLSGSSFMHVVGVIEIAAGIIVLFNPRVGAYIVSIWLFCIALTLFASGHYLDIAIRDIMMSAGAYTLARISEIVVEWNKADNKVLASQFNS